MDESQALAPLATAQAPGVAMVLPRAIDRAGKEAAKYTLEFFTARIPNPNTREAYGRAVWRFCQWCEGQGVGLADVSSPTVAAYLEALSAAELGTSSVKQHLAGIRHWLDWLTQRGVLGFNPAAAVRGPRHVVREGKTPVLERDEAKRLLDSLDGADVGSLRDRAILGTMLFGFVRVGAVVRMRVKDFQDEGAGAWLVLHEKGGKHRRIPAHHLVREYLQAYLTAAGFDDPKSKAPLFQTIPRRSSALSGHGMRREDVWGMVKRRCATAGLPSTICNHSFRATGITIHQENGGTLEQAAELAGHASTRTTQLYNRKARRIARSEVERVQL
jgi:site-specific recombinase XerD